MKITTCIFDSFVCDSGILDPCKILWLCKDGICLWMTWHGVQRNILRYLQKHFPFRTVHEVQKMCCSLWKSISHQSFLSLYQNTSHYDQNMMTSDKHFEGYSLYIWQLCLWFRHFWSSYNSDILQHCDLGIAICKKACRINLFSFSQNSLVWWLVTSILKVIVCVLNSFVCYLGIHDHWKLCFCSIVIWAFLTLVRFCAFAKMAFVCERYDMG